MNIKENFYIYREVVAFVDWLIATGALLGTRHI
jgi:hypothetical protein